MNLSLFICDKGGADFAEEELTCGLPETVRVVVVLMSLAAGQSITTALQFSEKRGIPVRDCFPIARSAVETLVNATYVLAVGESGADKAIRHAQQKAYRDLVVLRCKSNRLLDLRGLVPDLLSCLPTVKPGTITYAGSHCSSSGRVSALRAELRRSTGRYTSGGFSQEH